MTRHSLHVSPAASLGAGERGFSLIESIVSLGIMATGLLGLAAVFGQGMAVVASSPHDLIVTQKASEAIESVFTARDTRILTWTQISNVTGADAATGGVFVDGPRDLRKPGPDGMVNTADDGSVETRTEPGPDGVLGTPDDEIKPLLGYTREIEIRDVSAGLRQIRVIVKYQVGSMTREFILASYISTYA